MKQDRTLMGGLVLLAVGIIIIGLQIPTVRNVANVTDEIRLKFDFVTNDLP
ncbi:MAG: hypothetical protein GY796_30845 [Chloroflexi bacterium]|nr:hypothetical protein [Chloroflexota bacterium]